MRVALVGCGKAKLRRPAPAQDLYTGPLFKAARAWAERNCDAWYILSAKHGLMLPNRLVVPYDAFLSRLSKQERDAWAQSIATDVRRFIPSADVLVLLAGAEYGGFCKYVSHMVEQPLTGLALGKRLAWFKAHRHKEAA